MKQIKEIIEIAQAEGHHTLLSDDPRMKIYKLALSALEESNKLEADVKKLEKQLKEKPKPTKRKVIKND